MATCVKCSNVFEDNAAFCPQCGTAVNFTHTDQQGSATDTAAEKFAKLNDTADTTSQYDPQDIEKNKVMALLAYIIFLIPLLAAKDSPFARFHANQGLVLFIAAVLVSAVAAIPIIGWILAPIAAVAITIMSILGIVNAVGGKAKELPLIGKFKILK